LIGLVGTSRSKGPDKRPERGALDIEQVLDAEYAYRLIQTPSELQ